jgi:(S)-ureidoglycine aminohydrolase
MNPLDPHASAPVFGLTRTKVTPRYALISSDGFVPSVWPGARDVQTIFHITPAMGANFTQATCTWSPGGVLPLAATENIETFFFVLDGCLQLSAGPSAPETSLTQGKYALLPPSSSAEVSSATGATVFVLQKTYEPLPDLASPGLLTGDQKDHPSSAFLGHEGAQLQTLLPDEPALDLAVNLFTYAPGAFLPFVETHIMEHGLLMLSGHGIYRLGDEWFPVRQGDIIWMAPYCPQWFVAMGEQPASYLYYKNVNRLPAL